MRTLRLNAGGGTTVSQNQSMMAVEQVCPHRLVVQDITLSRRHRRFDFP
ncbi:uncharacterized protein LOC18010207 [Eutrema salsugineum]|nr:uncharacterized protein LOC18010207 [Eutrema salsugineum]